MTDSERLDMVRVNLECGVEKLTLKSILEVTQSGACRRLKLPN